MSNTDILKEFFLRVTDGLAQDAQSKGQKFPIDKMRFEADDYAGQLIGPHYVPYLIYGRGPGKFPPPDAMTSFVEANPDMLQRARQVYQYITSQRLGFLIGRKIAREGTDIYSGKRPGIDLLGVMDQHTPDLLKQLGENGAFKVMTGLTSALNKVNVPANAE